MLLTAAMSAPSRMPHMTHTTLGMFAALLFSGCVGSATGPVTGARPAASPDAVDLSCDASAGHVPARRLTADEYAATVRELLYLPASVNPAAGFAPEAYSLQSFETDAALLQMSPDRAENYLTAAFKMASLAWTNTRARWMTCDAASGGRACVEATLSRLATRAYRRPVTDAELAALMGLHDASASQGTQVALTRAVQALLISPRFLYLSFGGAAGSDAATHVLDDHELASRLSYFLWRSMPDDTLFAAAASGALRTTAGLRGQVERMLEDPRSAMVTGFAHAWLALNELETAAVDEALYPGFTLELRRDLVQETERFVDHVVRERRPLRELFLADYSFMNARVAGHYGRTDVTGDAFQKVLLPADGSRRGLLSHASVLRANAGSGSRTATTIRGHWVLEKFLCQPPPAPPAGVPAFGEKPGTNEGTLKQRLAAHRADPQCAGCHVLMDPVGLGLENFDVVGKWRTSYADGSAVEADGVFPDGSAFDGPAALLQKLGEGEAVEHCLAEKALSYALSRQVQQADRCSARAIGKAAFEPGGTIVDLVMGVVLTRQFQQNDVEVAP